MIGFYAANSTKIEADEDNGGRARLTIQRRTAYYGDVTASTNNILPIQQTNIPQLYTP